MGQEVGHKKCSAHEKSYIPDRTHRVRCPHAHLLSQQARFRLLVAHTHVKSTIWSLRGGVPCAEQSGVVWSLYHHSEAAESTAPNIWGRAMTWLHAGNAISTWSKLIVSCIVTGMHIRRSGAPNGVPADLLTVKTREIAWHKLARHEYDRFGTEGERYRGSQSLR